MKKALFFALALAAICIIPSCKKNPAQTKVVFGDTHGMSVTSYDSTLSIEQYAHYSWGNTVDLDGDGQNDIQFHSQDVGSAGLGHDIVTTLKCINENVALLGDIINQEKYFHIDSSSHTQDSVWWSIVVYKTYTCEQIAETDSVVSSTEKLTNVDHSFGDSYGLDDSFMNTNVVLKNRSYEYPSGNETIGNATYHYMILDKNDCDFFPMDEEKYIGFKLTENNQNRLGWMKVILHYDHVEILETAIQK